MAEHWVRGFGVILVVCVGCSGEAKRDPEEPSTPLVPGTCVNTDCSWPEVAAFHPGPERPCAATQGAPITVEWSAEARTVDCPAGECIAAPFDVAVGASEEAWTSAQLLPSAFPNVDAPIGFELQRNDPDGALELEHATHTEQPLYEPTLDARGLSVTADGELEWVGPSPKTSGLSLLHYDRTGALTSAKWLVQHASGSQAHFGSQGITVAYRYVSAVDTSEEPPKVTEQVGVARFDSKGHLRWNQAAFSTVNVPLAAISLVGVDAAGSVYAIVQRQSSFEAEAGSLIIKLSNTGSVDWVREMDNGTSFGAIYPTSEGFVIAGWGGEAGTRIDGVDALGNGQWRTQLPGSLIDGLAISMEERIFVRALPPEFSFLLSSDATSCAVHSFDLETYLSVPNGGVNERYSKDPAFARLSGERFAFAYSGRSGVLQLP